MPLPSKLSAIALSMLVAFGSAFADQSVAPAERDAIRSVITKQLQAFANGDAAAAEAFASAGIQQKFPEPAKFFDMVKSNYAALIKPKSTEFGEISTSPQGPAQKVTVVAADGTIWTVIYLLEKTDDGWRISGCGMTKIEGQQDI